MERDVCKEFLEGCNKFRWFIVQYFGEECYHGLVGMAERGECELLLGSLNRIWFELPDSIFNIRENPHGWYEFLSLIEE